MKTKTIPFDLETAKKIQAGEIEGRIVRGSAQKQVCEILDFAAEYQDKSSEKFLIVKVPAHDFEKEKLWIYHQDGRGRAMHSSNCEGMWFDLVLEVPDEPQFKPFDKVLVRNDDDDEWEASYYSHIRKYRGIDYYSAGNITWSQCISYEGNEHLLGTTDKPKED